MLAIRTFRFVGPVFRVRKCSTGLRENSRKSEIHETPETQKNLVKFSYIYEKLESIDAQLTIHKTQINDTLKNIEAKLTTFKQESDSDIGGIYVFLIAIFVICYIIYK
jgi:hypothetical protein